MVDEQVGDTLDDKAREVGAAFDQSIYATNTKLFGVPRPEAARTGDWTPQWLEGRARVGLTAGASAPEVLVQDVIDRIRALGAVAVRRMEGIEETVKFPLPKGLKLAGDEQARKAALTDWKQPSGA